MLSKFANNQFDVCSALCDCSGVYGSTEMGINWPTHSRDLSPFDFFLCRHLKNNVYLKNSKTISELKFATE